jgi:hypothetical protein
MARLEGGDLIPFADYRNRLFGDFPEIPIPREEIGLHLASPHPGNPEFLGIQLVPRGLGKGIDFDAKCQLKMTGRI